MSLGPSDFPAGREWLKVNEFVGDYWTKPSPPVHFTHTFPSITQYICDGCGVVCPEPYHIYVNYKFGYYCSTACAQGKKQSFHITFTTCNSDENSVNS